MTTRTSTFGNYRWGVIDRVSCPWGNFQHSNHYFLKCSFLQAIGYCETEIWTFLLPNTISFSGSVLHRECRLIFQRLSDYMLILKIRMKRVFDISKILKNQNEEFKHTRIFEMLQILNNSERREFKHTGNLSSDSHWSYRACPQVSY